MLPHHHPDVHARPPEAGTAIVSKVVSPQGHGSTVTVPDALPLLVAQTVVEPQNHEGKITLAPGPIVAGPAALAGAAPPNASAGAPHGAATRGAARGCPRPAPGPAEGRVGG